MFAVQADGAEVDDRRGPAPATASCTRCRRRSGTRHALQCGFCTPGFLMTLTAFLRDNPTPSEDEIREALSGNLCRCTGYQNIVQAALDAAAAARAAGPAA